MPGIITMMSRLKAKGCVRLTLSSVWGDMRLVGYSTVSTGLIAKTVFGGGQFHI